LSKKEGSITDIAHNMSNISGTRSGFFTGKRWTLH